MCSRGSAALDEDELFDALDEAAAARLVERRARGARAAALRAHADPRRPVRRPARHPAPATAPRGGRGARGPVRREPRAAPGRDRAPLRARRHRARRRRRSRTRARAGDRAAAQSRLRGGGPPLRDRARPARDDGFGRRRGACELLLSLGEALSRAGEDSEAKEAFRRAAAHRRALGAARPAGTSGASATAAGSYGPARAATRPWSRSTSAPWRRSASRTARPGCRLLARLAAAIRDEPLRDRRVALAHEAVEIARRLGDPVTLAFALEGQWPASRDRTPSTAESAEQTS